MRLQIQYNSSLCVEKYGEHIRFIERKPVFKTSERGSSSAIHTVLDRLALMVKRETQYIMHYLGLHPKTSWGRWTQILQAMTYNFCHPLLLLFLCQLVGDPSCTLLRSPCILMHIGICTPIIHPY